MDSRDHSSLDMTLQASSADVEDIPDSSPDANKERPTSITASETHSKREMVQTGDSKDDLPLISSIGGIQQSQQPPLRRPRSYDNHGPSSLLLLHPSSTGDPSTSTDGDESDLNVQNLDPASAALTIRALQTQNTALRSRLQDLTSQILDLTNRNNQLSLDVQQLSQKLVKEAERRGSLEGELDKASKELEDLSRELFEEANGMVSKEAMRRAQVETEKTALQKHLEHVEDKLMHEKKVAIGLRRRLSAISLTAASLTGSVAGSTLVSANQSVKNSRVNTAGNTTVNSEATSPVVTESALTVNTSSTASQNKPTHQHAHAHGHHPTIATTDYILSNYASPTITTPHTIISIPEVDEVDELLKMERLDSMWALDFDYLTDQRFYRMFCAFLEQALNTTIAMEATSATHHESVSSTGTAPGAGSVNSGVTGTTNTTWTKLFDGAFHPFMKYCLDEFVEPCLKLNHNTLVPSSTGASQVNTRWASGPRKWIDGLLKEQIKLSTYQVKKLSLDNVPEAEEDPSGLNKSQTAAEERCQSCGNLMDFPGHLAYKTYYECELTTTMTTASVLLASTTASLNLAAISARKIMGRGSTSVSTTNSAHGSQNSLDARASTTLETPPNDKSSPASQPRSKTHSPSPSRTYNKEEKTISVYTIDRWCWDRVTAAQEFFECVMRLIKEYGVIKSRAASRSVSKANSSATSPVSEQGGTVERGKMVHSKSAPVRQLSSSTHVSAFQLDEKLRREWFVAVLLCLKHMFYARVGVLTFYKNVLEKSTKDVMKESHAILQSPNSPHSPQSVIGVDERHDVNSSPLAGKQGHRDNSERSDVKTTEEELKIRLPMVKIASAESPSTPKAPPRKKDTKDA